jgi:DNA-binding PadR family transcriptional regulator
MQAIDFICHYSRNVLKTDLTFLRITILANLTAGRNYAHEIASFQEMKSPSIITVELKKLEKKGYVRSYNGDSWLVTQKGKELLTELLDFVIKKK